MFVCEFLCVCGCVCLGVCVCVCVYLYVCLFVYVYVCLFVGVFIFTQEQLCKHQEKRQNIDHLISNKHKKDHKVNNQLYLRIELEIVENKVIFSFSVSFLFPLFLSFFTCFGFAIRRILSCNISESGSHTRTCV